MYGVMKEQGHDGAEKGRRVRRTKRDTRGGDKEEGRRRKKVLKDANVGVLVVEENEED